MDTSASNTGWNLEEELRNNHDLHRDDVENLRYFCESLPCAESVTDEVITAILHSNEYDLEEARSAATKYFELRANSPEVFESRHVDGYELQAGLDVLYFCPLPTRSPEGYRIVLQKMRRTEVRAFDHAAASKVQFLTLDALIHAEPTCPGYVFVADMRGMSVGHLFKSSFFLTKKLLKYAQEGIPIKIQKVLVINASSLSDKMLRLVKPFVRKTMWDLVKLYPTSETEEFHETLPRACMPRDYGGDLADLETLHQEQIEWLSRLQPVVDLGAAQA